MGSRAVRILVVAVVLLLAAGVASAVVKSGREKVPTAAGTPSETPLVVVSESPSLSPSVTPEPTVAAEDTGTPATPEASPSATAPPTAHTGGSNALLLLGLTAVFAALGLRRLRAKASSAG
ncbi:MAG: hypothetical protein WDA71_06740 [Actinomycetota bacterium]